MSIDYTKYSLDDLIDISENIDKSSYPERYQEVMRLIKEYEKKGVTTSKEEVEFFESLSSYLSLLEPWLTIVALIFFILMLFSFFLMPELKSTGFSIMTMWLFGASIVRGIFSSRQAHMPDVVRNYFKVLFTLWFLVLFSATINLLM